MASKPKNMDETGLKQQLTDIFQALGNSQISLYMTILKKPSQAKRFKGGRGSLFLYRPIP